MNKYAKIALIAAIIVFLFWNPYTRQVVLFILPLGSGFDDLVFIVAVAVAAIYGTIYYITERKKK